MPFSCSLLDGGKRSVEKDAFACFSEPRTATPIEIRVFLYVKILLSNGYKTVTYYKIVTI